MTSPRRLARPKHCSAQHLESGKLGRLWLERNCSKAMPSRDRNYLPCGTRGQFLGLGKRVDGHRL